MTFRRYRRTNVAEMMEWGPDVDMDGVSVSDADRAAGSPKPGDMIARNPKNHGDRWLVSAAYFRENFEPLNELPPAPCCGTLGSYHRAGCFEVERMLTKKCRTCGTGFRGDSAYCSHFCYAIGRKSRVADSENPDEATEDTLGNRTGDGYPDMTPEVLPFLIVLLAAVVVFVGLKLLEAHGW